MANGPLHSGRRGLECLGNLRVQYLRDGIDHIHIVDGDDDRLPQVLVALDVSGDTDLVDDARYHGFDAVLAAAAGGGHPEALPTPDFLQPLRKGCHIAGLQHQIPNPQICCRIGYIIRHKRGCSQRNGSAVHGGQCLQHPDAILLGQHQIQHQNLRPLFHDHSDRLFPVRCRSYYLKTAASLQCRGQTRAEFLSTVRNEYGRCVFHNFLSCQSVFSPHCAAWHMPLRQIKHSIPHFLFQETFPKNRTTSSPFFRFRCRI